MLNYQRVQTRYDPWILQGHPTAGRWASMGLAPEVQHWPPHRKVWRGCLGRRPLARVDCRGSGAPKWSEWSGYLRETLQTPAKARYFDSLQSGVVKQTIDVEEDVSQTDTYTNYDILIHFVFPRLPYSAPFSMEPVAHVTLFLPDAALILRHQGVEDSVVALRNALGGYGDIQWSVLMWWIL